MNNKDEKKDPILKRLEPLVSFSLKENIYELELEEKGSRIRFRRAAPLPCDQRQEEGIKKSPDNRWRDYLPFNRYFL